MSKLVSKRTWVKGDTVIVENVFSSGRVYFSTLSDIVIFDSSDEASLHVELLTKLGFISD